MPAVFEIGGSPNVEQQESWVRIGTYEIDTTGFLGVAHDNVPWVGTANLAFPSWMTLPPRPLALEGARSWHILMMWVFVANLCFYYVYGFLSRRFWRELVPSRDQLRFSAIVRDLWMHIRFKHSAGTDALRYNFLQKLAYLVVIFGILPIIWLTGMTMSHAAVAAYPWLLELFGGKQTARTLHFICANLLLLFVVIHIIQLFVVGFWNSARSMITGYFRVQQGDQ